MDVEQRRPRIPRGITDPKAGGQPEGRAAAGPRRSHGRRLLDHRATSAQIRQARPDVAVFGIGAIEQHAHHLPLGTDWLAVSEAARRVAEELAAYLVPALPFSMSQCHGPMAGTVWLRPKTLAAVVADVVTSLQEQGIHRIVLVNGHGGNFVLEAVIRELNLSRPRLRLIMPGAASVLDADHQVCQTADLEVHAGEAETSVQLAIDPGLVTGERFDYVPPVGREFLDYAFMGYISERGVWGCATLGTAEKGRVILERQVQHICRLAREAFALLDDLTGRG